MTGPRLTDPWLTTEQAAALAGVAPVTFRKAVQRSPVLRKGRAYLGPLACYSRPAVEAWMALRPPPRRT